MHVVRVTSLETGVSHTFQCDEANPDSPNIVYKIDRADGNFPRVALRGLHAVEQCEAFARSFASHKIMMFDALVEWSKKSRTLLENKRAKAED